MLWKFLYVFVVFNLATNSSLIGFPLPKDPVYIVTGMMPGQNPDEILAAFQAVEGARGNLLFLDTTTIYPERAARLLKFILTSRGYKAVPVYPGFGVERAEDFAAFYPRYPFGKNPYPLWGKPYFERFPHEIDRVVLPPLRAGQAIVDAAERYPGRLVLIATGPLSNVAEAIQIAERAGKPEVLQNGIAAVVTAGSWLKTADGRNRLSFNLVIDLAGAERVLKFVGPKAHLLDSPGARASRLQLGREQLSSLLAYSGTDGVVAAFRDDVNNWMTHTHTDVLNVVDPLAVLAGLFPKAVKSHPRRIRLHPERDPSIQMLDPRAPELFDILPDSAEGGGEGLTINLISGFKQPDFVRTPIVRSILNLSNSAWFSPVVSSEASARPRDPLFRHRLKEDRVLILGTDAWFDVDDLFAVLVGLRYYPDRLLGLTTTLWHPLDKATYLNLLLDELGFPAIPVYPGQGVYSSSELPNSAGDIEPFRKLYPYWPWKQFGAPYPHQGEKIREIYSSAKIAQHRRSVESGARNLLRSLGKESAPVDHAAVEFMLESARRHPGRLTVVCLGPMHNVAEALRRDPGFAERAVIVVQGGWMTDENGTPTRLGYNTVQGLKAADTVTKSGIPVLLINSQAVAGLYLDRKTELPIVAAPEIRSNLARLVVGEMINWAEHARNTMGEVQYADPVTVIAAGSPDFIESADPVRLELFDRGGTMLDPAADLFTVRPDKGSRPNVFVVTELNRPDVIRQRIGSTILGVTNPGLFASPDRCRELLAAPNISGDRMVRKLFRGR